MDFMSTSVSCETQNEHTMGCDGLHVAPKYTLVRRFPRE